MTTQTFTVGAMPRVHISRIDGDLDISSINGREAKVDAEKTVTELYQEGDALVIAGCAGDVSLRVPADCAVSVGQVRGDVEITGVHRVEVHDVDDDVTLSAIAEAVEAYNLKADLSVTNTPLLRARGTIGGDVGICDINQVEIDAVGNDLALENVRTAIIGTVGDELTAKAISTSLRCGHVGDDCTVSESITAEIALGSVGGDLKVAGAATAKIGGVGDDCLVRDVTGALEVGNVGGDAELRGIGGNIESAHIGGNATLNTAFPSDSRMHMHVGGDLDLILPEHPNLTLRAAVGGNIRGRSTAASSSDGGGAITLVYGDGAARLDLRVGGDLELRGDDAPRSSSSSSWSGFGREMDDFGREMADLGRELGRMGREIAREIMAALNEAGIAQGVDWAENMTRKAERQARRTQRQAERQARRAHKHRYHNEERAALMHVRFNDREWRLDPERLERIKEQARRAAAEGVAGALEAVERALGKIRVHMPSADPLSSASDPDIETVAQPGAPFTPATGQTIRINIEDAEQPTAADAAPTDTTEPRATPDIEQERETILRLIAEGRISPEEGDLLLEALGS